jgi:hypothetical protein
MVYMAIWIPLSHKRQIEKSLRDIFSLALFAMVALIPTFTPDLHDKETLVRQGRAVNIIRLSPTARNWTQATSG